MASQGKGKRKIKGPKQSLQSFLHDGTETPAGWAVAKPLNWADDVDDEEDEDKPSYEPRRDTSKVILPTVPKSVRAPDFDVTKVPDRPPFKAYLGNLPYDINEEDVVSFFRKLKVKDVTLIRDGDRGRIKGVGFAEFEDKDSLIDALQMNGDTLKNRSIRVSLSEGMDNDRTRHREERDDRTAGDWRSGSRDQAERPPPSRNGNDYQRPYESQPYQGRSSNYERSDRRGMDRGFDRSYQRSDRDNDFRSDNRSFSNRGGSGGGGFRDRDFGYRDRGDREERSGGGYGFDDRRDRYRDNRSNENRDFRDRDRDREGGDRSYNRNYGSGYESRRGESASSRYSPSPPVSVDGKNNDDKEAPKERPKLKLQPRTKPIKPASEVASANSAIFGGAKPVDTAAREREIEEKLAREQKEKEAQLSDTGSSKGSVSGRRPVRLSRASRDERSGASGSETPRSEGQSQGDGSVDGDSIKSDASPKQSESKKSE